MYLVWFLCFNVYHIEHTTHVHYCTVGVLLWVVEKDDETEEAGLLMCDDISNVWWAFLYVTGQLRSPSRGLGIRITRTTEESGVSLYFLQITPSPVFSSIFLHNRSIWSNAELTHWYSCEKTNDSAFKRGDSLLINTKPSYARLVVDAKLNYWTGMCTVSYTHLTLPTNREV